MYSTTNMSTLWKNLLPLSVPFRLLCSNGSPSTVKLKAEVSYEMMVN